MIGKKILNDKLLLLDRKYQKMIEIEFILVF